MPTQMTIGQLAGAAGVNVETIRFYQRRGLLDEPARPIAGARRYAAAAVQRVCFIKRAQQLGFTLAEVIDLLKLEDGRHCGETRELAERKLALVAQRIADLKKMSSSLTKLIGQCRRGGRARGCPIIETLSRRQAVL